MLMTETSQMPLTVDDIDLYPAHWYQEGYPHAAWRTLRAQAPIRLQHAPDGTPFWSVTRYRDVVDVLRDTRRFSSEYSTMLSVLHEDAAKGKAIHLMDPPRHSEVRASAIRAMSMRIMREHEDRIHERIRRLVASAVAQRELDFARLIAGLPMLVVGEIIGIPEDKWAEAAHWTIASMAPEDPAYSIGQPDATLRAAHVFLFSMFIELVGARRQDPSGDDLISLLARTKIDGRPATDEEVLVNCYAFIMGANPTIPQAAAHLVLVMAHDPALWQRVRSDRLLLPTTLEEVLRWSSPVNHLLRRTTEEVRLGDHLVPKGGLVAAWIASANRDEEVFTDPYVFDPARKPNPHVTFGYGSHRCIGNSAAASGLRLLLKELVTQVESIEISGQVRHLESNFLNGIISLPVVLHPAAGRGHHHSG